MADYLTREKKSLKYRLINNISVEVTTHMWNHYTSVNIFHRIT